VKGLRWPARHEIRVDSVLDDQWADWFGGLQLGSDGAQTVIIALLPDQPALHVNPSMPSAPNMTDCALRPEATG
jgi:hypothetical protein